MIVTVPAAPHVASSPSWPWLVVAAVRTFALSLMCWLAAWAAAATLLFGLAPTLITSGSMSPGIRPGDLVLTSLPASHEIIEGDVVTFRDPAVAGRLMTHRVDAVLNDGTLRTRGDANAAPDSTPVPMADVVGKARLLVPMVGLPLLWVHEGQFVLSGGWLLLTLGAVALRPPIPATGPRPAPSPPQIGSTPRLWTASTTLSSHVPTPREVSSWPPRAAAVVALVSLVVAVPAEPVRAFAASTVSSANTWDAASVTPPSSFTAQCVNSSRVDLSWSASPASAVTGYRIDRRRDGENNFSHLADVDGRATEYYSDTATPFRSSLLSLLGAITVEYRIHALTATTWQSTLQQAGTSGTVTSVLGLAVFNCN